MLHFYASALAEAVRDLDGAALALAIEILRPSDDDADGSRRTRVGQDIKTRLSSFRALLERNKLPLSQAFHAKLIRAIQGADIASTNAALVTNSLIHELQFDMIEELKEHVFLSVSSERRKHYHDNGCTFGKIVEDTFPDATVEIKAANRCFALDEWTACVFHLMRALEIALHKWATELGVVQFSAIELENWKNILDAADKKVKTLEQQPKSARKDAELQYYGETIAHYRSIKDAWRNHVAHARERYNEGRATSIMNHVREFMVLLASRP